MQIYVDGDACPVKDEVVRVAERHGIAVTVVANSWMRLPHSALVERVIVDEGPDVADDWIAERIAPGDIVVTGDIMLASRCLNAGAKALAPNGKPFSDSNIGMALAMRDLMSDLRDAGEVRGNNPAFTSKDRSRFLQALEQMVQDVKRGR